MRIEQTIYVERESQRKIVLGKAGQIDQGDRRGGARASLPRSSKRRCTCFCSSRCGRAGATIRSATGRWALSFPRNDDAARRVTGGESAVNGAGDASANAGDASPNAGATRLGSHQQRRCQVPCRHTRRQTVRTSWTGSSELAAFGNAVDGAIGAASAPEFTVATAKSIVDAAAAVRINRFMLSSPSQGSEVDADRACVCAGSAGSNAHSRDHVLRQSCGKTALPRL